MSKPVKDLIVDLLYDLVNKSTKETGLSASKAGDYSPRLMLHMGHADWVVSLNSVPVTTNDPDEAKPVKDADIADTARHISRLIDADVSGGRPSRQQLNGNVITVQYPHGVYDVTITRVR